MKYLYDLAYIIVSFFLIIVVYLGGLIVEYREGTQETAYGIGIHLLGHEPASDLWSSSWEMRGRTNCGRGCSFSFFIGYDKTIEERWGMVNRQIKTSRGEMARCGRGYKVNTEVNLQWNCSR